MKLAVVLLNWNGETLLRQFLPSTLAHSREANIYVIDNGSTDGSLAYLNNQKEVTTICLEKNWGFAEGYNLGLQQIDADLYCLLNTDVEVSSNWLTPLLNAFTSNLKLAVAQPHILDYYQKTNFEYAGAAGGYIDALGYAFCRGRLFDNLEQDNGQYDDTTDIAWASGACFFIRKNVFDRLGGFDSRFFAHQEEIDLCWRARNLGFNVQAIGASKVYHIGGGTLPKNTFKLYLNYRNALAMLTKNLPANRLLIRLFLRMLLDGIAGVRHLLKGEFRFTGAILKAHFYFYRHFPTYLKQRQNNYTTDYYYIYSVVYQVFIKKIKKFSTLLKNQR